MGQAEIARRWERLGPLDLSGVYLCGMDLSHTNLLGSKFAGANLALMNFEGSNLSEGDFESADLSKANLAGAKLCDANLRATDLRQADLRGAILKGADLSDASPEDAHLEAVDLSEVVGLTWEQFLEAWFDEATVAPGYLTEDQLLRLLEAEDPDRHWRRDYSGKLQTLLKVLAEWRWTVSGSALNRAAVDRIRREAGKSDTSTDD